ncbi:unnamed protein product [marine sediment metagenome]|uniref:Uncharacterized protein n=1 Tax=marine sediment metagenome TaxID=412755 RepID=X0TRA1_9ZZZZ
MEERKKVRREEAEERQKKHEKLSVDEKIGKLDKNLGKGIGARKERAKLAKKKTEVKK